MLSNPQLFFFMFAGVTFGMVLGALPGLTGSMGIALMLPFTYKMDPLTSLVFLLSIYTGGLFGGSITAVLINTPGSPANIATSLDGYAMTVKGESEKALGLSLWSSVVGGIIGCLFLVFATEPLASISLKFGAPEMFFVAVFGLTIVGSLSDDVLKSIFSALFGVLLGTIGMSSVGNIRGTFGSMYLLDGIPLIPALIGFLAIPSILDLANQEFITGEQTSHEGKINIKKVLYQIKELIKRPILTVATSLLGVIVGVMPAAGATIASLLSYNQAKQYSKNSKEFGQGAIEGVIASETANNASQGGALATMLVLGIPGSNSTAMLLGALIIQGWVPGPRLFIDNKEIIYASISSLLLQQIVMLIIGILICALAAKIINVPVRYLVPIILMFSILGAFSSRNAMFDAKLMLLFGVIGWIMKKSHFPTMPIVLGIILGPLADRELLRIMQLYDNFFLVFKRPITLILALLSFIGVVLPLIMSNKRNKIGKKAA